MYLFNSNRNSVVSKLASLTFKQLITLKDYINNYKYNVKYKKFIHTLGKPILSNNVFILIKCNNINDEFVDSLLLKIIFLEKKDNRKLFHIKSKIIYKTILISDIFLDLNIVNINYLRSNYNYLVNIIYILDDFILISTNNKCNINKNNNDICIIKDSINYQFNRSNSQSLLQTNGNILKQDKFQHIVSSFNEYICSKTQM